MQALRLTGWCVRRHGGGCLAPAAKRTQGAPAGRSGAHLQPVLPELHVLNGRLREGDAVGVAGVDVLERVVAHAAHAALPVGGDHDAKVLLVEALGALHRVLAGGERRAADAGGLQVLQRGDDERVAQLRRVPGAAGGEGGRAGGVGRADLHHSCGDTGVPQAALRAQPGRSARNPAL